MYTWLWRRNLTASAKQRAQYRGTGTVFDNLRPDLVLTIADRYETLATAVAAVHEYPRGSRPGRDYRIH